VSMARLPKNDGTERLQFTLQRGAKLYAIHGATLVNTAMPTPELPPLALLPVQRAPLVFDFEHDAQGWSGVDKIEPHDGYVTIMRAKNLRPIAHATPLPGDWSQLFGGDAVTLSARIRAPKPGGAVRVELFANDVSQWTFEKLPPFTQDWQTISVDLHYNWTDEQAKAAGWMHSSPGFSWRETIQHAGKVVIMAGQSGTQETFDLDDVQFIPK